MKFIIVRLEGGLGNQMFQYAFARAIQNRYGGRIFFDKHTFKNDAQRSFSLDVFELNENVSRTADSAIFRFFFWFFRVASRLLFICLKKVRLSRPFRSRIMALFGFFIQDGSSYYNYMYPTVSPVRYIGGNWMSSKYFTEVSETVKSELRLRRGILDDSAVMKTIKSTTAICVHIRRGDYVQAKWAVRNLVCDFDYYNRGLIKLAHSYEKPEFFIFSNTRQDISWIKKNYPFDVSVIYVDEEHSDFEDFALMVECKHFILSNSTYSWWASYLAIHDNKSIIAPSKWNTGIYDQSDIYEDDWTILNV